MQRSLNITLAVAGGILLTGVGSAGAAFPGKNAIGNSRGPGPRDPNVWVAAQRLAGGFWPRWSPDGRKIAFVGGEKGQSGRIYVMDPNGRGLRPLTPNRPGTFGDSTPTWSPDGQKIAFDSNRTPRPDPREIWVMKSDGSAQHRLTTFRTPSGNGPSEPAWSPSGRIIAFSGENTARVAQIYVMDADGKHPRPLTARRYRASTEPAWSPDGKKIAFARSTGGGDISVKIWVMNADGSDQHPVTTPRPSSICKHVFCGDSEPTWSPDGRRIAFSRRTTLTQQIYVMDSDGKRQRQVSRSAVGGIQPDWSPDGREIAFSGARTARIYVISVDGTHERQLP